MREKAAANKLTRVGMQGSVTNAGQGNRQSAKHGKGGADRELLSVDWESFNFYDQESYESDQIFEQLSKFRPIV